ncbi:hypothetical protein, partial [Neisseria mucosa]|uniref:hypothetical protein n=1 Tax=Neisseria mucosa TaxID=488 RepID=UPI0027DF3C31
LLKEGAHEKSPKCLDGNLGDFGEFCKGLKLILGKSTSCLLNSRPHGRLYFCLSSNPTERKAKAYE